LAGKREQSKIFDHTMTKVPASGHKIKKSLKALKDVDHNHLCVTKLMTVLKVAKTASFRALCMCIPT
jgi:hypothetical protein